MIDRNVIIDKYKDYEDRLLVNNLISLAESCKKGYTYKYTHFLNPRQQGIAENVLDHYREISYYFEGCIEAAERRICIIHPEGLELEEIEAPVEILEIRCQVNSFTSRKISHRDILGSLIGSGIKREMIGDIILEEASAFVACTRYIAQYILNHISRVGKCSVTVDIAGKVCKNTGKCKIMNATVASLRVDSILSSGFGVSREKAAEAVKGGKVKLNWEEVLTPSKEVKLQDVVSLRGRGRLSLEEINGNTKKDRIKVVIRKYV